MEKGALKLASRSPPSRADGLCARFQPRMVQLVAEAKTADPRNFRTLTGDRAWQQIVGRASLPIAVRLTNQALIVVTELLTACEELALAPSGQTLPPPFLSFELTMDAAVRERSGGQASVSAVEDVAFLVQMELRQRADRLARLGERSQPIAVIGECDSAVRRIRKGFGAIDAVLVAALHGTPAIDFTSELSESLAVRRAYARLRTYFSKCRAEQSESGVSTQTIESNLRASTARINSLVEGECGTLLRVRDRLQIVELQDRIGQWLMSNQRGNHVEARRLWQDVLGFVEMLTQVNRRQELVEHDWNTISTLLSCKHEPDCPDGACWKLIRSLEGVDEELDLQLASVTHIDQLRASVTRLAEQLGVSVSE